MSANAFTPPIMTSSLPPKVRGSSGSTTDSVLTVTLAEKRYSDRYLPRRREQPQDTARQRPTSERCQVAVHRSWSMDLQPVRILCRTADEPRPRRSDDDRNRAMCGCSLMVDVGNELGTVEVDPALLVEHGSANDEPFE